MTQLKSLQLFALAFFTQESTHDISDNAWKIGPEKGDFIVKLDERLLVLCHLSQNMA